VSGQSWLQDIDAGTNRQVGTCYVGNEGEPIHTDDPTCALRRAQDGLFASLRPGDYPVQTFGKRLHGISDVSLDVLAHSILGSSRVVRCDRLVDLFMSLENRGARSLTSFATCAGRELSLNEHQQTPPSQRRLRPSPNLQG
jgi:hypothetical protein